MINFALQLNFSSNLLVLCIFKLMKKKEGK